MIYYDGNTHQYQACEIDLCFFKKKKNPMFTCPKTLIEKDLLYAGKQTHRDFEYGGSTTQLQCCHTPKPMCYYLSGTTFFFTSQIETKQEADSFLGRIQWYYSTPESPRCFPFLLEKTVYDELVPNSVLSKQKETTGWVDAVFLCLKHKHVAFLESL